MMDDFLDDPEDLYRRYKAGAPLEVCAIYEGCLIGPWYPLDVSWASSSDFRLALEDLGVVFRDASEIVDGAVRELLALQRSLNDA